MSRRPGNKVVTVDRPRQKGWWGSPDSEDAEANHQEFAAEVREPVKRVAAARMPRQAVQVGRALTTGQLDAIRAVMHLFVEDDLGRGLDPASVLFCDRCDANRTAAGSVRYERLTFCNSCATEFEIARGRGLIDQAFEFVDRGSERARSA